jgi:hypothetical protein
VTPTTELLAILDGGVCTTLTGLARAAEPPPLNAYGHVDFRTRAARQWFERFEALLDAGLDMIDAGLAEVVIEADGYHSYEVGITDAGRRYLAEIRALP